MAFAACCKSHQFFFQRKHEWSDLPVDAILYALEFHEQELPLCSESYNAWFRRELLGRILEGNCRRTVLLFRSLRVHGHAQEITTEQLANDSIIRFILRQASGISVSLNIEHAVLGSCVFSQLSNCSWLRKNKLSFLSKKIRSFQPTISDLTTLRFLKNIAEFREVKDLRAVFCCSGNINYWLPLLCKSHHLRSVSFEFRQEEQLNEQLIDNSFWAEILSQNGMKNVQTLRIVGQVWCLDMPRSLPSLRHLVMPLPCDLSGIQTLENLEHLELQKPVRATRLSPDSWSHLSSCKKLRTLSLYCNTSQQLFEASEALNQLIARGQIQELTLAFDGNQTQLSVDDHGIPGPCSIRHQSKELAVSAIYTQRNEDLEYFLAIQRLTMFHFNVIVVTNGSKQSKELPGPKCTVKCALRSILNLVCVSGNIEINASKKNLSCTLQSKGIKWMCQISGQTLQAVIAKSAGILSNCQVLRIILTNINRFLNIRRADF